jgi:hypothetical protein
MAKDKPRNASASIRQRLLNHSTAIKTDPNLVLIWYGLERFLYRLSVSTHSERFILKGAMLFRLWGGANFRSTKDLDLEGFLQDEAEVVREVRGHGATRNDKQPNEGLLRSLVHIAPL